MGNTCMLRPRPVFFCPVVAERAGGLHRKVWKFRYKFDILEYIVTFFSCIDDIAKPFVERVADSALKQDLNMLPGIRVDSTEFT